ncbi:MAG TPA: hypothetical protein VIG47_03465, partial [Gemmatimonadaceae bacterium]
LYYTDARARSALSSTATGLSYASTTGIFSLAAGYAIPLTASSTDWNSAYANRLTSAAYPLQISSNAISLAFGTTTANSWSALQTFGAGFVSQGSSTVSGALTAASLTGTNLSANTLTYANGSKQLSSVTLGTGLTFSGGTLSVDGGAAFSTTSADYYKTQRDFFSTTSANTWLTGKSTDNLAEGSTNLYFTNARVNAYVVASTTIAKTYAINTFTSSNVFNGGLTIGALTGVLHASSGVVSASNVNLASEVTGTLAVGNGGTGSTTLSGLLKGNGTGALLSAVAGTDYENPLTFSSPLSRAGNTISIPAANGSTNGYLASGDWTLFNNKISSTSLSAGTGISYNSSTGVIGNTGLLSLAQSYGSAQTGALTLATSSATTNGQTLGLNITNTGTTFTFTPTLSGTLTVAGGGTGSTTLGGLLKGNGTGSVLAAIAGTDYQAPVTLTTTGTSGAATFSGGVLNIPQYSGTTYTAAYPVTLTGSTFGLAFGTTTANMFSALNTFNGGLTAAGPVTLSSITGSTQCLHVSSTGVISGTGSDCGTGTGGVTGITAVYPLIANSPTGSITLSSA